MPDQETNYVDQAITGLGHAPSPAELSVIAGCAKEVLENDTEPPHIEFAKNHEEADPKAKPKCMKVGWPDTVYLQNFGFILYQSFGHNAYVVGSVNNGDNKWRDVDVVMILPDEEFNAMFPDGDSAFSFRWEWTCAAWSELGRKITGLPIDFKIQSQSISDLHRDKGWRNALGFKHVDHKVSRN